MRGGVLHEFFLQVLRELSPKPEAVWAIQRSFIYAKSRALLEPSDVADLLLRVVNRVFPQNHGIRVLVIEVRPFYLFS